VGAAGGVVSGRLAAALAAAAILVAAIALIVAGGGSSGSGSPGDAARERVDLMLDFFPNADHAGIYAARAYGGFAREGLDVHVRAPSDPSTPLKLVAAGKTDFAISYEPEVLRARDKGLPVVAVAALVRVPLTAIVSLPRAGIRTPTDLRGKTVGTAGIDYQTAYLKAIQPAARVRNVGFDLVPALISKKVDAVLGAYWNYEAVSLRQHDRHPHVIRIEHAGVPTYDELVVVANERTVRERPKTVRRFVAGLAWGGVVLDRRPQKALEALMAAAPDLDERLQRTALDVTIPYLLPKSDDPYGYMDPAEWKRFTAFMHSRGILKRASPAGAFTNRFLP
jgi:putative hydroxymethylpyrimidine transport system substrate-binding protein